MSKDFKHILLASLGAFSSLMSVNFVNASENKADGTIKNENNSNAANNKATPVKPTNKPKNENLKGEKDKSSSLANILKIWLSLLGGAAIGGSAKHVYDKLYGPSLEKYSIDNLLWQSILATSGYYTIRKGKNETDINVNDLIVDYNAKISNDACAALFPIFGEKAKFYSFYASLRELMDKILGAKEFKQLHFKFDENQNKKFAVENTVLESVIRVCLSSFGFVAPMAMGGTFKLNCYHDGIALDMPSGEKKFQGKIEDDGEGEQKKVFKYEATFNMSADRKLSLKEFKVIQ